MGDVIIFVVVGDVIMFVVVVGDVIIFVEVTGDVIIFVVLVSWVVKAEVADETIMKMNLLKIFTASCRTNITTSYLDIDERDLVYSSKLHDICPIAVAICT